MARRRLFCKTCSNALILWGKSSGKNRYRCLFCKTTRTYHGKKRESSARLYALFKQYVLWGNTYEMLSSLSSYSIRFLEGKFHGYFTEDPPGLPLLQQAGIEEAFLLIDGLWFTRLFVLMVYRQSGNLYLLRIAVYHREVNTQIAKDLLWITTQGYHFTGIVSDGGTGIVKAVTNVFPHIVHQICLAHRGLKKERWEQFLKWFVYFYNEEKLSRKRTKED